MCLRENTTSDIYCDKLYIFTYETTLHEAKCITYKSPFSEPVKYQENDNICIYLLPNIFVSSSPSDNRENCQLKCCLHHNITERLPKCSNIIYKCSYDHHELIYKCTKLNSHHFYVSTIYLNLNTNTNSANCPETNMYSIKRNKHLYPKTICDYKLLCSMIYSTNNIYYDKLLFLFSESSIYKIILNNAKFCHRKIITFAICSYSTFKNHYEFSVNNKNLYPNIGEIYFANQYANCHIKITKSYFTMMARHKNIIAHNFYFNILNHTILFSSESDIFYNANILHHSMYKGTNLENIPCTFIIKSLNNKYIMWNPKTNYQNTLDQLVNMIKITTILSILSNVHVKQALKIINSHNLYFKYTFRELNNFPYTNDSFNINLPKGIYAWHNECNLMVLIRRVNKSKTENIYVCPHQYFADGKHYTKFPFDINIDMPNLIPPTKLHSFAIANHINQMSLDAIKYRHTPHYSGKNKGTYEDNGINKVTGTLSVGTIRANFKFNTGHSLANYYKQTLKKGIYFSNYIILLKVICIYTSIIAFSISNKIKNTKILNKSGKCDSWTYLLKTPKSIKRIKQSGYKILNADKSANNSDYPLLGLPTYCKVVDRIANQNLFLFSCIRLSKYYQQCENPFLCNNANINNKANIEIHISEGAPIRLSRTTYN